MAFVSYAQNFEDVMLWRALRLVEGGFYIDIGAMSPTYDSVTRAFYERGWNGINIEPNPFYLDQLRAQRPRDINLGLAITNSRGTVQLHVLEVSGLSTLSLDIARVHEDHGIAGHVIEVQAQTLAEVWKEFVPSGQDVHFLKVDVEGSEEDVLNGNDWRRFRPWIIVLEATFPNSQRQVHQDWEGILSAAGYAPAYWDGLNMFYVADERSALLDAFRSPPNVFDAYELFRYTEQIGALSAQVSCLSRDAEQSLQDLHELRERFEKSQEELVLKESAISISESALQLVNAKLSEVEQLHALERAKGEELSNEISLMRSTVTWRTTQTLRQLGDKIRQILTRIFG